MTTKGDGLILTLKQTNTATIELLTDTGWGLIVAWGLGVIFTPTLSGEQTNMGVFWLTSMIGAPVGLLAFYFAPHALATRRSREIALFAAVAGMTLGLAPFVIPASTLESVYLQGAGGFISALGSAVFTVLWGRHYASLDMARIERMATTSLILAFICYVMLIASPAPVATLLIYCLPFCSAACLVSKESNPVAPSATKQLNPRSNLNESANAATLGKLNVAGFMRLGFGVVGATTVVSLFWSFANNGIVPALEGTLTVSLLSGLLVAVLIEVYVYRFSRSLNLGMLYRWVLPLIAIAFSTLLFRGPIYATCASLLVNAAQALLNLTTFVYFAELSQRTGASAVRVFGLGRFFLEVGFLVGMLLFPLAKNLGEQIGFYQGALFMALTFFIVLAMFSIASQDRLAFTLEKTVEEKESSDGLTHLSDNDSNLEIASTDTHMGRFSAVCDQVANEFGLTKREREILPFLAQGFSLPFIRNELYISQSTIDTHVRHIYKKMNIHSKEDLITCVLSRLE